MVLTWEAKVVAVADAAVDVAAVAETNWKHKVTPDWDDLIRVFNAFLMPILVKNKTYFLLIDIIITSVNKIRVMQFQLCFSKNEIKNL